MEQPYNSRVMVNDHFDRVEIIIPVKTKWILFAFPAAFIVFWWFAGGKDLIGMMLHKSNDYWFDRIWLLAIAVGLVYNVVSLYWMLAGKEVIQAERGSISIQRKGDLFTRTKTYDLAEAKYFRAEEDKSFGHWEMGKYLINLDAKTIAFEYGSKTIKFGENLPQEDGDYILKLLKNRKILTDKNFV